MPRYPSGMDNASFLDAVYHEVCQALDAPAFLTDEDLPAFEEFLRPALSLLESGKRTRALLIRAGFEMASSYDLTPAVRAGAAMELYQASALIHDDVIDDSPTRRGKPAAHMSLAASHRDGGWAERGDDLAFGRAGAIVLGDFLYACAFACLESAIASRCIQSSTPDSPSSSCEPLISGDFLSPGKNPRLASSYPAFLRSLFISTTSEVAFGQYVDIRAEYEGSLPANEAVSRALRVLSHKTVGYSVAMPLLLGAGLGGGSEKLLALLAQFALPFGEAFQLRDDILGIFGDPVRTGKPACGDITEGKETVLLCLTRELAYSQDVAWISSLIGRCLEESEVVRVRTIVEECGARARVEEEIESREARAQELTQELRMCARATGVDYLVEIVTALAGRRA